MRGPQRLRHGFTLAELLVVLSVIVILVAVSGPALKGILGGSGRKAATIQVLGALERARATAIEKNAGVYVGFPIQGFPAPALAYTRYILFRDRVESDPGDPARAFVPISGWEALPSGVVFWNFGAVSSSGAPLTISNLSRDQFPPIPGLAGNLTSINLRVIKYNGTGSVEMPATGANPAVWIREGFYNQSNFNFVPTVRDSGTTKAFVDRVTVARFSGRSNLESVPPP